MGNLLGILAGFFVGFFTVLLAYKKSDQSLYLILFGNLFVAIIMLPFVENFVVSLLQLGVLFYLGCFQIGLPYILYNKSFQKISSQEASLFSLAEPILNPIWAYFFIHERPSFYAIVGGGLILGALLIKILWSNK